VKLYPGKMGRGCEFDIQTQALSRKNEFDKKPLRFGGLFYALLMLFNEDRRIFFNRSVLQRFQSFKLSIERKGLLPHIGIS
jgi:hypothetical protein